jgi:hypothetical protein
MNWNQLCALVWLRWRLTVNQWRRGGEVSAVISMLFLIVGLGVCAIGGILGLAGGILGMPSVAPKYVMLIWDGLVAVFLFLWTIGLVSELQRSEIIDLSKLMHLPISLRNAFFLNYLSSHLSFSLALFLPAMLGLALGMVVGCGPAMILLLPLVFGFFFMITAWTYCLRSWLAALMVNKRRRRAIIMTVTMIFVLLFQMPNLIANVFSKDKTTDASVTSSEARQIERQQSRAHTRELVYQAHEYVPFLWLPQGAKALKEGHVWPAVWGACGLMAFGMWGMLRAYRTTVRFYKGQLSDAATPAPVADRQVAPVTGRLLVERTLPMIPDDAAALAFANLRSLSRAPEVKMGLATNVVMFAIIGAGILLRDKKTISDAAHPFILSAAVTITFMGLPQLMSNHFGFDRNGFRALVLLPTSRWRILLGKNLSILPFSLAIFAIFITFASIMTHPQVVDILTVLLEFVAAFLSLSAIGNFISILVPYRIASGTLKATSIKGLALLLVVLTQLLFTATMLPIFLPAGLGMLGDHYGLPGRLISLICALVMTCIAALAYLLTLKPLGQFLQRREQAILLVVTHDVE